MTQLLKSVFLIALITVAIWFGASLFGFSLALVPSLLISIALTVLINLPALSRRRRV
ncbi:MAG: hypothetical protein RIF41_17000 [Polyangiaceae bacterium]